MLTTLLSTLTEPGNLQGSLGDAEIELQSLPPRIGNPPANCQSNTETNAHKSFSGSNFSLRRANEKFQLHCSFVCRIKPISQKFREALALLQSTDAKSPSSRKSQMRCCQSLQRHNSTTLPRALQVAHTWPVTWRRATLRWTCHLAAPEGRMAGFERGFVADAWPLRSALDLM